MHKVDNAKLAQNILSWIGKVTSFPVVRPYGVAVSNKSPIIDCNIEPGSDQCCSGGYNEVFILEHWASYGPRH